MLHNGYLNVLVSTGTVGAAVMLCYIVLVVALVCKKFFGKGRKNYDPVALTALLVVTVMVIATLFLTRLFFSSIRHAPCCFGFSWASCCGCARTIPAPSGDRLAPPRQRRQNSRTAPTKTARRDGCAPMVRNPIRPCLTIQGPF